MNGKYGKLARAVFTSGIALVINCLVNLILTPFITATVGIAAYGFVSLSKNLYQYAAMLTEALNSFSARYIALAHHEDRKKEAGEYFSSTFFGNVFISIAVSAVMLPLVMFADRILHVPDELLPDVRMLFFLTALTFLVTTLFTVYGVSAFIVNRLDIVGIFKSAAYISEALVLLTGYRFFKARIAYVGLSTLVSAVVVGASNYMITRRFTPYLRVKREHFRLSAVRTLVGDGIWTSLNSLGVALNNGLDLLVCDLMLTPVNMGQLAIAKTFHSLFSGLFIVVATSFQPMLLKSWARKNRETFLSELKMSMKVSGFVSNLVFAGFLALGMSFYSLWIPGENIRLIYLLTLINNITAIPGGPMQPLYFIYVLTLKKKFPTYVTIAGGVLNVAGMYLLIKYTGLGVYAVVWTTAVVMMVINFITNPLYMAHVLGLPKRTFYPDIIRNVISCGAMCLVFTGIAKIIPPGGWGTLVLTALLCVIPGILLHTAITCSREERRKIIRKAVSRWNTGNSF